MVVMVVVVGQGQVLGCSFDLSLDLHARVPMAAAELCCRRLLCPIQPPPPVAQVYVHYTELLNFLRATVSLLGLPPDAGPSAVMVTLATLVEQSARWGGGGGCLLLRVPLCFIAADDTDDCC